MFDIDLYTKRDVREAQDNSDKSKEALGRLQEEVNFTLGRSIKLSDKELAKHGIKREEAEVDGSQGVLTDFPNGISSHRGKDGDFTLIGPPGSRHKSDKQGNDILTDKNGKVLATQKADGTITVPTEKGTYTETPDRNVKFDPKPRKAEAARSDAQSQKPAQLSEAPRQPVDVRSADVPAPKKIVVNTSDPLGDLKDDDIDYVNRNKKAGRI